MSASEQQPNHALQSISLASLIRIGLFYVFGVVLSVFGASVITAIFRPGALGGLTFPEALQEIWNATLDNNRLAILLMAGALQAIIYRTMRARKGLWFVAAIVALTCSLTLAMQILIR